MVSFIVFDKCQSYLFNLNSDLSDVFVRLKIPISLTYISHNEYTH